MLQSLQIVWCENLRMFPGWLQSLRIGNCNHDIRRRCEKDKGEDWHIISHIPDCYIDDPEEEAPSTSAAGLFSSTSTGRMHASTITFNLPTTCYNDNISERISNYVM